MQRWLQTYLKPPRYSDFEEDRLSRVGINLLAFLLVFSPVAAITNFVLSARPGNAWIFSFFIHFGLLVMARVLIQKRRLHSGLLVMLVSLWWILNWSAFFFAGGVASAVYGGNLVVVVLAGLLLGRRGAILATFISILAGLVMVLGNQWGYVPPDVETRTDWSEWVTNVTFFLCILIAIYLFVTTYEHTLKRWQLNEGQLRQTNEKLRQNAAKLEAQNEVLQMMQQLTLDLLNRRQLAEVLTEVLDRALSLFAAENGYVYLLHADGKMRIQIGRGHFANHGELPLGPGEGLSGKVWQQNEALRVDDYDKWAGRHENMPEGLLYSLIGVPLHSGQAVVGVLGVTRDRPGKPFTEHDVTLLTKFAELTSIALDNAHLFTTSQTESAERIQVENRNLALLNAIPDLIMRVDADGNYLDVRSPHVAVLPVTDLGRSLSEILPQPLLEDVLPALGEALQTGTLQKHECIWPGTEQYFDIRVIASASDELLVIWRNITERYRSEKALREKQKLESLGVLAGGVAHDFNNLLTSIMGQTSLLEAQMAPDDPLQKHVRKAVTSAERAADLTQQLLAYAGRSKLGVTLIDLNQLVRDNDALIETALSERATLTLDLQEKLPPMLAERGQIQQLIMNLVINAAEALPEPGGIVQVGTSLRLGPIGPPDTQLIGNVALPAGPYICLEVRDTGHGMAEKTLERIFDPFFTTKESGHGLGLSATLGIIRSYQGGLAVTSTPRVGSLFQIFFPAQLEGRIPTQERPSRLQMPAGSVLIIDDEPGVREAVQDLLSLEGVQVLEAPNGQVGLELFRDCQDEIDLVIIDMVMPGMSGPQTLKAIRELDARLPILMSSGYSREGMEEQLADEANIYMMPKPFDRRRLLTMVSEIMVDQAHGRRRSPIATP